LHKVDFYFSKKNKILFFFSYVFYILIIPLEVKQGKIKILISEAFWLLGRIFKFNFRLPKFLFSNYYETIFGKFYISPDLLSTIAVSPVFERLDVNYLVNLLKSNLKNNKRILFLDIGAYFGLYSVIVGNTFSRFKKLDIIAFEPGTDYLSASTVNLLKKNIKINNLNNIKIKTIGIGSRNTTNKLGIQINTLDSILGINYLNKYDVVVIKMDIDDFVVDGIKGIINSVNKSKKTYLFIEDFVKRKSVVNILKEYGFNFICKLTEYNSFWVKQNV